MKRLSRPQAARLLAYCERELDGGDVGPARRQVLEEKAATYRRYLAGHCSACGRSLEHPSTDGLGPECRRKAVSA